MTRALLTCAALVLAVFTTPAHAAGLQAGAAAVDITPKEFPVIVNGGFLEKQAAMVVDRLHARAIVLDDGQTRLALCVVDTCMMTRELIDEAKALATKSTGIPTERMLISATHTHSAPSAMACLGTRLDPAYARFLPGQIAAAIETAAKHTVPAEVGYATTPAWDYTNCRRWIRRPDKTLVDPFGVASARANMHPGYLNPDAISPSGPIDPGLSLLSVRTRDGQPLALLANFSMHYFGAGPVSADYFGKFASGIGQQIGAKDPGFVGIMSQGTSGDSHWMDYSQAKKDITSEQYAAGLMKIAAEAYAKVEHRSNVELAMAESRLKLRRRVADAARLEWAKKISDGMGDRIPANQPEVYAREQLIIAAEPERELKLQAIRIGELGITAIPDEVYAITGLKLKAQSPLKTTFNIELANGSEGYIPPPEQHVLGGYTTWAARTAGLQPEAEPRITETLLGLLEQVSGEKRRPMTEPNGPYAEAILAAQPLAYWRMNEIVPPTAHDATGHGHDATYDWQHGVAFYLLGVGQGLGASSRPSFTTVAFSGPGAINRAPHFAGGSLHAEVKELGADYSISFWAWNGLDPKARATTGILYQRGAERLGITGTGAGADAGRLFYAEGEKATPVVGKTPLLFKDWNYIVLVREGRRFSVYLDGRLELSGEAAASASGEAIDLGGRSTEGNTFEGRIDEAALFGRALKAEQIAVQYQLSGPPPRALPPAPPAVAPKTAARVAMPPPTFTPAYAKLIASLAPIARSAKLEAVSAKAPAGNFSASFWFRNDLANNQRAVAAYLFSRGPAGDSQAPGDHLGIGGNYRPGYEGRLMYYNGNARGQTLLGTSTIAPGSWNHVLFVREGKRVISYLNGKLEFSGEADITAPDARALFLGARCDQFAPLQGALVEFTLHDRALTAAQAADLAAAATFSTQAIAVAEPPKPNSPPLSPAESLAKVHVPPGFKVEQMAVEPLLLDPVAFDWDERGRLWVVEMADYPLGLDNQGQPGGRVRVLEDTDGDGRYDKSTLFAEGLNFPNGLITWRDGVIITAAPNIIFLRDTNGDGRADEQTVLISGLQEGNQQLRANSLRWGLDNWVYVAAGGHHGKYGVDTRLRSWRSGEDVQVGSRDFRFRPDTGELEPQSGPTQFGRNRDNWGHWFGSQNSNPLWHYVLPDHYLRRNPFVGLAETRVQLLTPPNPPVFPASPLEKRFHSFDQSGRFTSACSGMVLRDTQLFPGNEIHGFVCEPFHNLVQHARFEEAGVTFSANRVTGESPYDFFASEDRWTRPVMVREGPDGALWVADMYRYMIEHPQFLPPVGKDELLPHYRAGEDRGRLYRVSRTGAAAFRPVRFDQMSTADVVATLQSSNGWQRDKAQQVLIWRGDRAAVTPLQALATQTTNPLARLHAMCTLDALGALTPETVAAALGDPTPGVRENALRLAESRFTPEVLAAALKVADDPDAKVRLQLAFSLGATTDPAAGATLARLLRTQASDTFMVAAIMSSARPHLRALAEVGEAASDALLNTALGQQDRAAIAALLPAKWSPAAVSHLLGVLAAHDLSLDSLRGPQDPLSRRLAEVDSIFAQARHDLANSTGQPETRIAAAALLGQVPADRKAAVQSLAQWLAPSQPAEVQKAALTALQQTASDDAPTLLAAAWPALGPTIRPLALAAWMNREPWAFDLVERVAKGEVASAALDTIQRARLLKHDSARVRAAAAKVFAGTSSATRAKVIEAYQPALTLKGDVAAGHAVYQRVCTACHQRGSEGKNIGPDLASVIEHPAEKLLTAILDPNADIQPGFNAYTCTLKTGEQLYGLVSAETANSVTMKLPDASLKTVLRNQIATLQSQNISLMPEGLEGTLTKEDLANLIAFLHSPITVGSK